jgi:large subunit ribosomal protein L22
MVRKTPVDTALEQLRFSSKKAALPLAKLINSGIANAIHNFNLNRDNLYIKSLTVDGGPVYKRYAPRAQGRAFTERKRTSHINLVLESRVAPRKKSRSIFSIKPKAATPETVTDERKGQIEPQEEGTTATVKNKPKQAPKASERVKQNVVNLKRRLFNRRSGS